MGEEGTPCSGSDSSAGDDVIDVGVKVVQVPEEN